MRLRQLREEKGVTQQTVADGCGIDRALYARYENGTRKPPSEKLVFLADYFGVSIDYLLGREAEKKPAPKTGRELDHELISLLCQLTPEQVRRVKDFVQGILSAR